MKTYGMNTNVTDATWLAMSILAGFSNLVDQHGGFLVTAAGALLFGIIRWQQHKQTMKNLKLDEELKRKQLKDQ